MITPERTPIIDVPISAVNEVSCTDFIDQNIKAIRGQYICVANAHSTVLARECKEYMAVQAGSVMTVPDGKPLAVIGQKRKPKMGQVTGVFLMRHYLMTPSHKQHSHFFYGSTAENLERLIQKLSESNPGLCIAGYRPSVFRDLTDDEKEELAEHINGTKPDIIWVALGVPRQENFCAEMKGKVDGLMIGIGGALNVVAGIVPDAPRWMKKMGLEWLHRLIKEPRRLFMRYLVYNSKFVFYLFMDKVRGITKKC